MIYTSLIVSFILIILSVLFKKIAHRIEKSMLFVPTTIPKDHAYPLENLREKFKLNINPEIVLEEINIIDPKNGKELNGIWFENPNKGKIILYAHGNAGCVGTRLSFLEAFAPLSSVLMFDYRGYGKSVGTPSEKILYEDILTAYEHLVHEMGISSEKIIIYGESLGCAPVAWLGNYLKDSAIKPAGIIMQCGFSSVKNIAGDLVGRFVGPILSSRLNNISQVKKIGDKIKVMVAHSRKDELIDYYHAELLMKANPHIIHHELTGSHSGPENFTTDYLSSVQTHFLE